MKSHFSIILLVSMVSFFPPKVGSQSDPGLFLGRYLDNRDKYSSYQAEVDLALKYFSSDDTLYRTAFVELLRVKGDSLFGGHVYIEMDTLAYGYNGDALFELNIRDSTLQAEDPITSPGLWIRSTWVNNYVDYSFLTYNQGARSILTNPEIKHRIVDTLIGNYPCKAFYYYLPDEPEFTNTYILVAIDTVELLVRKRITSTWFQGNQQYFAWTYHNPRYRHQTSIDKLDNRVLNHFRSEELTKNIFVDSTKKLDIDYSTLEGKILGEEAAIALKDVSADVIILDFWYSSCYPCIKSIPEVNKIMERFRDKNVTVYGVNIIDNEAANKTRIEKYLRNNPMLYKTIMADGNTYSSWVQKGYPTLLVLDKHFNLILEHTGYSELMADEITALISDYLEKQ